MSLEEKLEAVIKAQEALLDGRAKQIELLNKQIANLELCLSLERQAKQKLQDRLDDAASAAMERDFNS